jgi:YHS domain-containing protein
MTLPALTVMAQKTETKPAAKTATKATATKVTAKTAKAAPVKFTACMVTGEKLGSMGEPIKVKYKDQEYPLCCEGCRATFNKNPEKYIKEAMAKMKTTPAKPATKTSNKKA